MKIKSDLAAATMTIALVFGPLMLGLLYTKSFILAGILWVILVLIWGSHLPKNKKGEDNESV